jgi:hypothetical protein
MVIRHQQRRDPDSVVVTLQEFRNQSGITDVEIRGDDLHLIIEAKRGWTLPSAHQLRKYVGRFRETKAKRPLIVTMAERTRASSRAGQNSAPVMLMRLNTAQRVGLVRARYGTASSLT